MAPEGRSEFKRVQLEAGSMRKRRSSAYIASQTAQALMWGPKTRKGIAEYVGVKKYDSTVIMRYVIQYKTDGMVYIEGWENAASPRYAWQPSPYLHPDAPRPEKLQ